MGVTETLATTETAQNGKDTRTIDEAMVTPLAAAMRTFMQNFITERPQPVTREARRARMIVIGSVFMKPTCGVREEYKCSMG